MGRKQWYVARIETGECRMDILDIEDFAATFGVTPGELADYLLGRPQQ